MREKRLILSRFLTNKLTVEEYIALSRKILDNLRDVHPIFSKLHSWGKTKDSWTEININDKEFRKTVFEHIKDEKIKYENQDSKDIRMSYASKCFKGFRNSYSNTKIEEEGKITISIDAGGRNGIGILNVQFPKINYEDFKDIALVKKIMSAIIKATNPEFIAYTSEEFMDQYYKKDYKFHLGYANYFKDKDVINYLPSDTEIESFEKGLVFGLSEGYSLEKDRLNSDEVSNLRDKLGSRGFLNYP